MKLRKVIVAPDSFKGSLSAQEAADAIIKGVKEVSPMCECVRIPVADGGEGTVEALADAFAGYIVECCVSGPDGTPVKARYAVSDDGVTAIMEMAQAAGIMLVSSGKRNPLFTTTYGVGEMILDAIDRGCRKIYMGLGGSATNDGGMGMLSALGYRFEDGEGNKLQGVGGNLGRVVKIECGKVDKRLREIQFVAACDVDNPFYGENGAARVFAPQKGADMEMVRVLDAGMEHFAGVVKDTTGVDVASIPGSGAAGGLGGAFTAFLNARMVPGIDMVLEAVAFEKKIKGADLIITGEGRIDSQSLMGKVLSGILKRGNAAGIPVIAFGGTVKDAERLESAGFAGLYAITPESMPLEQAMRAEIASQNLTAATAQALESDGICRLVRVL